MKKLLFLLLLTSCLHDHKDQNLRVPDAFRPHFKAGDRFFYQTINDTFSVKVSEIYTAYATRYVDDHKVTDEHIGYDLIRDTVPVPFCRGASINWDGSGTTGYFRWETFGNYSDTISGRMFHDLVNGIYDSATKKAMVSPVYSWSQGIVKWTDTTGRVWRRKF